MQFVSHAVINGIVLCCSTAGVGLVSVLALIYSCHSTAGP